VRRSEDFSQGYILFSPLFSSTTYLIDSGKNVVHTWESDFPPGVSAYLLENGNLLRTARHPDVPFFLAPGQGGRIQEITWEGELVWDFTLASGDTVWEYKNPFSGKAPNPAGDPPFPVFRATHLPKDHPALITKPLPLQSSISVMAANTSSDSKQL
jgi:hypothetical protein